ncbi:SRPBCC family protein [Arenimonas caeni]|uniref:Polyketide cyclase n=1 Tax=Arenimonas caeni TaxID=2058085 RepID=A0A2P6M9Y3_9GAMM|nr:SRPBCC family protein [Arenimonas caeni]PRH82783.1 polyketide cyclase [Arenimonas caeni]
MTRVIEWLISLLIVVALFVAIGLFLPASRSVSHSVETNRPMATVNDILSGFTRFSDWNALINHDPRMQIDVTGPANGVGAKLGFRSNDRAVGEGSWELVEFVPGERIVYSVDNNARGENKKMTFEFERTGQRKQNVKITQTYDIDYGWDLIGRYAGMYVTDNIGEDIKLGLGKFSNLLATIPRFDYSQHEAEFAFVDVPAANVLSATATAKRSNDEIALAMTNQLKWIETVMEANDLEAAGPLRIITNEFGADAYGFDVVLPVRKEGTGPAEESTDESADESAAEAPATEEGAEGEQAAEGEGEYDAQIVQPRVGLKDALDSTTMPERLEVKIEDGRNGAQNPVLYLQVPAHRAAVTTYVGPSPGLARVRDLVRAWAMVNGAETADRPYEDYRIEIKDMLSETAEFQVYWPVRVNGEVPSPAVQLVPEPVEEERGAPPQVGEAASEAAAETEAEGDAAPAEAEAGSAE